jgi:peptidoglycan-associated lipoprotein
MKENIILCFTLVCFGCAEHTPPKTAPSAKREPTSKPISEMRQADTKTPQRGVINISEDIRKACGISEAEAHFPFDSAKLGEVERPALGKLAKCFVSGPLAGREMQLVGHADPRGDSDYNMVLGGSRADTVKTFLVALGLSSGRIATSSRGELDASGTDDRSWAEDRRVDVLAR